MRLNEGFQHPPRHDAVHFFQEDLFARALGFDAIAGVNFGKADLFHVPDLRIALGLSGEVAQRFPS